MLTPSEIAGMARAKAGDVYDALRSEMREHWRESDDSFERAQHDAAGMPWMRRRRGPAARIVVCQCGRPNLVVAQNAAGAAVVLEPAKDGPLVVEASGLARLASNVPTVAGLKGNAPRAPRGTHRLHTHRA